MYLSQEKKDLTDNKNYNANRELEDKQSNAGTLWSIEEERQLIEEYIMKYSITEISKIHKRTRNAIRKRLKKLVLIK